MTTTETRIAYLNWLKVHWFQVSVLAILFLFVAPPAYYFLIQLPQQRAASVDQQLFQSICLAQADNLYDANWANQCKSAPAGNDGLHCTLPSHISETVERWDRETRLECFRMYPTTN
jgi:hypothetical protein